MRKIACNSIIYRGGACPLPFRRASACATGLVETESDTTCRCGPGARCVGSARAECAYPSWTAVLAVVRFQEVDPPVIEGGFVFAERIEIVVRSGERHDMLPPERLVQVFDVGIGEIVAADLVELDGVQRMRLLDAGNEVTRAVEVVSGVMCLPVGGRSGICRPRSAETRPHFAVSSCVALAIRQATCYHMRS